MRAKANVERREEVFHDSWAESVDVDTIPVVPVFESASSPENRQIIEWMGNVKGLKVLELGCGLGEASAYFAMNGADVTATDISTGMLDVARKLAGRHGASIKTAQASASDLSAFPDETFDIVYASNLLHHVNIEACAREVHRKLKPGGRAYFWDPLHYNPAINVYRRMATQVRTEDEHPLKIADIRMIQSIFSQTRTRYFWLTSLSIFFKYFLIDRIHPNQSRYWKKVIEDADRISGWLDPLHSLDRVLFRLIPGLKYWGWNIAIEAKK